MAAGANVMTTETALAKIIVKKCPSRRIAVQATVLQRQSRSKPVAFIHDLPHWALDTGYYLKKLLETATQMLVERDQESSQDFYYLHWGCLSASATLSSARCWFYTEQELSDFIRELPTPSSEPLPQVHLHFARMRSRFKPLDDSERFFDRLRAHLLDHETVNYAGQTFINKRHIKAVLHLRAISRLWSEDRLINYESYKKACCDHIKGTHITEVATNCWQMLAACILGGLSLLPLWVLMLNGINDRSLSSSRTKVHLYQIILEYPMLHEYLNAEALWLRTLLKARRTVSPHEWGQNSGRRLDGRDVVLPILATDAEALLRKPEKPPDSQRLVRIDVGYQHFSKARLHLEHNFAANPRIQDPEQLFVLKTRKVDHLFADMAWSDLEARSGTPQHPHLLNMCQAWLGAGCIELLYPAPDTNLSMYMRRGRPSPECVRLELWQNLWGIASAIEFLHGLTLNNTRGWRHDISPDSFLIFNSDIGKAIWKLGNLEVDSLHGKDLVIQEHRRAEIEPKMIKNPVGNFIKEHPPPESRKVHANSIRTRPFDIWILGCVFVEVLAWVFLPETSELASMPVDHTRFWLRDHDAVARTAQWTQDVLNGVTRENPESAPARTLADLIKRMLNPIPQARCQISEVTTQLQDILSQQGGPHPQQDSRYPGFIDKKDDRGLFLASDTESLPGLTEASTGSVDEDEAEFAEISAYELLVGMRPLVIEDETRLELGDPVSLGADELDTSLSNRKPEFLVPVDVDKTTLPGPQRVPLNLSMTSGQRRASNIKIPRTSPIKLAEDSSDRRYSVEDTESGLNPTGKVGGGASLASGQHVGSDTFTVPLFEEANLDSAVKAKLEDWWRSRSLESVKTKMGWNSLTGAERQRCVGREVMARPSKARVPETFYAPAGPLSSFWGETMMPHFQMFVAHELKLLSQRRVPSGTFIFELLIVETKNWLSLSGGSIQRRPVICMIFQNDRTRKVWKLMERKLDSELSLGFELRFMVASVVLL